MLLQTGWVLLKLLKLQHTIRKSDPKLLCSCITVAALCHCVLGCLLHGQDIKKYKMLTHVPVTTAKLKRQNLTGMEIFQFDFKYYKWTLVVFISRRKQSQSACIEEKNPKLCCEWQKFRGTQRLIICHRYLKE